MEIKNIKTKSSFPIDRIIRITIGSSIIIAGIIFSSPWGIVGVMPLLAGVINKCPSFLPAKYSACEIPVKDGYKEVTKRDL